MEENSAASGPKKGRSFTIREFQVLRLMVRGMSNNEIADDMEISAFTVKAHVASILEKMDVSNRVQAAVRAIRDKLFCFLLLIGCFLEFADLSIDILCAI